MCEHHFIHSVREGYLKCGFCGSFMSIQAVRPENIYNEGYWTHEHGHSTLKEQAYNVDEYLVDGTSKCRFVLDRIESKRGAALEIGCAPGRLLLLLKGIGEFQEVVGVEACEDYVPHIREIGCFGGDILVGLFPDIQIDKTFDYICALDVLEHSWNPVCFVEECFRLLNPGGQLFLMLPLAGELEDRFFEPKEHVWIFSRGYLDGLLQGCGFSNIKFDRWTNGHDTVSARRID